MRGILFDLDGVFYVGDQLIDGALETLKWCAQKRIPYLFVTNTTSRPPQAIADKLGAFGIETDTAHIMSPPVAARQYLERHQLGNVALYVAEVTHEVFAGFIATDSDEVDAVIVGDMGEAWTYPLLNRAFRQLMHSPSPVLLALGMTRYWQAPEGLRLDAGAFVTALSYASGVTPIVLGKPAEQFFASALAQLGLSADEVIMIGDDIHGDIDGAQRAGIRGLLVRTGKFRDADLDCEIKPYAVLDSIAALPAWWPVQ